MTEELTKIADEIADLLGYFVASKMSGRILPSVNQRPKFTPYRHPILTPLVV
ncbi:hypothetical protein ABIA18_006199 [Sinorhizobium fredii]